MTKAKRIAKKNTKFAAPIEEVKVVALTADELVAKAQADFAARYPERPLTLAPTTSKKLVVEPEEVVEEIIDDLERGEEEDELEIIEVPIIKGKKVISQNSVQAQKLLAKVAKPEVKDIFPEVVKKKLADMTPKEKATYYAQLSKKATAAKTAKAEAKLAAEGKTGQLEKVPETTPKSKRTTAPEPIANPLSGKVIPEGTTGSKLKTLLKEEKKAAKKGNKPASTRTKGTTPLSKMTIEELEAIKGTIADVQWNKYFKMAGGVSGGTIKKASKPVVVTAKDKLSTLIEKESDFKTVYASAKKATRTVAEPKAKTVTLADFTLDELIEELKARGCKGTIKVCAEVEL